MAAETDGGFDALLDYVKRSRGFDFSGYKHTSLMRRMRNMPRGLAGLRGRKH